VVFVLIRFGPSLRGFFADLSEVTLKAAEVEASLKRKQAEAAGSLVAAAVSKPAADGATDTMVRDARAAAAVVTESVTPRTLRQARNATALWVDDRPDNNVNERASLEAIGVSFVLSTSTEDALEKASRRSFHVIISDMGRGVDQTAGYHLLEKLRASGDRTPFIIYVGSRAPGHRAEAKQKGALDTTNRPDELFALVLSAIDRKA
jgi:CheY-like chemotaxis protein